MNKKKNNKNKILNKDKLQLHNDKKRQKYKIELNKYSKELCQLIVKNGAKNKIFIDFINKPMFLDILTDLIINQCDFAYMLCKELYSLSSKNNYIIYCRNKYLKLSVLLDNGTITNEEFMYAHIIVYAFYFYNYDSFYDNIFESDRKLKEFLIMLFEKCNIYELSEADKVYIAENSYKNEGEKVVW